MEQTGDDKNVPEGILAYLQENCPESFAHALSEERSKVPNMRQEDLSSWLDYDDNAVYRWEAETHKDRLTRKERPLTIEERILPRNIHVIDQIADALTITMEAQREKVKRRLRNAYTCDLMKKELAKKGIKVF